MTELPINQIILGDCLEVMRGWPDKCVDLVLTDPPYNIGKDDWDKRKDYISYLIDRLVCAERTMKDTGGMWFSHMIWPTLSEIHVELTGKTNLRHIQFITVNKGIGSIAGRTSDQLRTFPRATEYLQFYGYDNPTGAERIAEDVAAKNPMAQYLAQELCRWGGKRIEIASLFPSKTGGLTGCLSNWLLGYNFPTPEQYQVMRSFLNQHNEGGYLRREYGYLRREYEDLRREYEDLRRPFNLPFGVTDVWDCNFSDGENNGHSTEKPISLIKRIISACSRLDDLILDPFAGSGTTLVAAKQLGRRYIGIEIEPKYVAICKERLRQEVLGL